MAKLSMGEMAEMAALKKKSLPPDQTNCSETDVYLISKFDM
jgi:hypothetical protein